MIRPICIYTAAASFLSIQAVIGAILAQADAMSMTQVGYLLAAVVSLAGLTGILGRIIQSLYDRMLKAKDANYQEMLKLKDDQIKERDKRITRLEDRLKQYEDIDLENSRS